MVTLFKRPGAEEGLDARIAGLRRGRGEPEIAEKTAPPPPPAAENAVAPPPAPAMPEAGAPPIAPASNIPAPIPPAASTVPVSAEDALTVAREELVARLSAEIRPERRALLSRSDLAKLVSGAVQAYFVRHAIESNPLSRRDLITDIMQALISGPGPAGAGAAPEPGLAGVRQLPGRKAAVEAAKAQIQPLVLEHMDVAAAAEMPRAAFEAQLTGWVKELLAETKIQLNFVEQRELVDSLIADMLGLGPLEPLIADETVNDIMVNGPKQVYVERRGKLELTDVQFRDDAHLMNVATKIVTRVGRRIDEARPLVDARLPDGSRVNIIIPPLALDGASVSISTIHANSPREALTRLENMIGMAGINLPSKAVRTQIASAIHMIAQVNRMRDGQRRVTHLMEVVGMEGDVITTQELFTYQFQGEASDGKLRGSFQSSGIRPAFLPRAEYFGLDRALLEVI